MKGWLPAPVLFVIASVIALLINYPVLKDQQKILKSHGANIFLVSSMIFAAGIFSGILTGSKMIEAMASALVSVDSRTSCQPVATVNRFNQYAIEHALYT